MLRAALIWSAWGIAAALPIALAATSPLLAWRDAVYIAGGFAGILAFALMLFQPLAIGGDLPGLTVVRRRRLHRWIGVAIVGFTVLHIGGLWLTSPPDVIDALLFRSPTPFAIWGVLAMGAVFLSAGLVLMRRRIGPRLWRRIHGMLAIVIVLATAAHAVLIEGAMEQVSKVLLCVLVIGVTIRTLGKLGHFRSMSFVGRHR